MSCGDPAFGTKYGIQIHAQLKREAVVRRNPSIIKRIEIDAEKQYSVETSSTESRRSVKRINDWEPFTFIHNLVLDLCRMRSSKFR